MFVCLSATIMVNKDEYKKINVISARQHSTISLQRCALSCRLESGFVSGTNGWNTLNHEQVSIRSSTRLEIKYE